MAAKKAKVSSKRNAKGAPKKAKAPKKTKLAPKKAKVAPKKPKVATKKPKAAAKKASRAPGQLIEDQRKKRLAIFRKTLGTPSLHLRGEDLGAFNVDVLAFPAKHAADSGFLLVTNGLSDHRVPRPDPDEAYPQVELVWYTRDASDDKLRFLYWLGTQPFASGKPIVFGSFVDAPKTVAGTDKRGVMFLEPITVSERLMHTDLALLTGYFKWFAVHLLTDAEFRHAKKNTKGFNALLDLFDKKNYPLFFDPKRASYV